MGKDSKASENRIPWTMTNGPQDVVIKYAWTNPIAVNSPVDIRPVSMADGYVRIGIRPNGQERLTMRFRRLR